MKSRNGFVSNSSSTSFIITNISSEPKTLVDFATENYKLVGAFNAMYSDDVKLSDVLQDAEKDTCIFEPNTPVTISFGDEDGTAIGRVYDYILRDGGKSTSFTWEFDEYLR